MRLLIAALLLLAGAAGTALATSIARPEGVVILTISGAIDVINDSAGAHFDQAMLEALPQTTIRTLTPWTDGETEFQGIRLADLLSAVGARGERIIARALNDYKEVIPLTDLEKFEIVVAIRMNGQYMRVRDKGPLWIVYDLDTTDSTVLEASRMVWQLRQLEVQ